MKVSEPSRVRFEAVSTHEAIPAVKPLITFVPDASLEACAEFTISLRTLPFLADHGFQDVVVLPGAFYIEMALAVDRELAKGAASAVRNVAFQNPVILSQENTIIRVEVRRNGPASSEYMFYDVAGGNGDTYSRQQVAQLEIERETASRAKSLDASFSIESFQAQAVNVIDSGDFYKKLRDNGNQYGPQFQRASSIWHAGNESLGMISGRHVTIQSHRQCILLDSMTQMLAPFMMARGRTFVLRSIDRIEIADLNFPDTLWCHAKLRSEAGSESNHIAGDVRVFGSTGETCLKLAGISFVLLDRAESEEKATSTLVVASNFTADPVEDSLKFWADHFNLQSKIEFAPYDQIFQQLLQAGTAFHTNKAGVNVILLQLEKWAAAERGGLLHFDQKKAEQAFGERKRRTLPNGLEIVHLNQYETDYVYQEIFEDKCYLKHGIRLPDGATVVNIGANIGLFSLFVLSRCAKPKIYSFEPAPVAYDLLKTNCEVYGDANARAFNLGVSNRPGTANFTFYEKSSVFSSFHSNEAEDREAIEAVVRNMLDAGSVAEEFAQEYVDELMKDRLRKSVHECRLTTVSEIIRENHIDKIDLLKIDAEKSELDIIAGIADSDWPKIDQVVIEIHDPTREAARRVSDLLIGKGYRCAIEEEKLLEHSGLFNLFATRDTAGGTMRSSAPADVHTPPLPSGLQRNVRDFHAALQAFTSTNATPLILCCCPASPTVETNIELKSALADVERELLESAAALKGVSTIGSQALLQRYPVAEYYDGHSHQLGDIPYTPAGYAAIGTALFRTIFNVKRKPYKAIVLDCDNTLWKGVCGEDGYKGVAVTEPYRALQQFMVDQMNSGMLLCLCSKNSEQDVLDVLDRHAGMLIKRDNLVSWRINWNSKSENIKSLASELNLGLDSFIFIDDNPVECADVEINCPDVLTLRLPQNPASFTPFLENIWAFDRPETTTQEDRGRARMYQDNAQRERFREQAHSMHDFVAGLGLRVEVGEATDDQLDRVSQLTFRTNQFNTTTIRRSLAEIRDFLKQTNSRCLAVRVADRFGDYGLVGVVLYREESDRLKLDTFLLSCRVLGRGVEHTIVSNLGRRALSAAKAFVELACLSTERNLPARNFVSSLGDQYRIDGESWLFPAEYLASLKYDPDEKTQTSDNPATPDGGTPALPRAAGFGLVVQSRHLQRIGEGLYDISRVTKAIDESRLPTSVADGAVDKMQSAGLDGTILNIWRKVLGRPGIGLDINFFEAGGTSLKAVQVIAMIRKELNQNLSITSLFECPTVRLLAAKFSACAEGTSGEPRTAGAALRGQQRRAKAIRRTRNR